ncbi:hypothetical protein LSTR_LSTR014009 [Laodelphax striatellus]|uniref:THAP-type domain-containing protein n=1 Tax=Laodelphax striatellus TaxID=195883 RepID=A0A482WNN4_LAOST|nr:hypothetical protein LSTR_LSTR014009 [Laodelphax striatellus]
MNKMCSVPNCENKGYNSNVKFYTFPLSEHKLIQRRRWIAALNKHCVFEAYWTPNKYNTICSEHFIGGKKSDAMNSPSYVPTIFPSPTPKGKRKLDRVLKQRTVGCVAPKCSNNISKGYRLFRFPRDSARREIWIQNCRLDNWKPTSTSRLCEAHFESSEWEANRIDGGMNLKPNAIPTIFNVPKTPKKKATKQSVFKMETVFIKQDPDSIQEPTTECSTAWFPIVDDDDKEEEEKEVKEEEDDDDDDDEQHQQLLSQGFQQIFFEEESPGKLCKRTNNAQKKYWTAAQ